MGFNLNEWLQETNKKALEDEFGSGAIRADDRKEGTNYALAGYETVRVGPSGSTKRPIYVPIGQTQPAPAPAPAPAAPAPAASSQTQLQITPQNQQVRDRTDEILAASDARMAEFLKAFNASNAAAQERDRLAQEAADRRAAEAQALQRTSAANLYRAGQAQNLQIAPAGGAGAPQTASGTSGFRRRSSQFNPSAFSGLNTIASGMVNL